MPENQSEPRSDGYANPQGEPRIAAEPPERRGDADRPSHAQAAAGPDDGGRSVRAPSAAAEPRSFGADDIEGIRSGARARRFAD